MDTQKPSGAPDTKLHFLDYWRIIRIRKTVILAVFLLVVLTTTAVTFILPEQFASTVRIEVGKDNPDIAPLLYGAQNNTQFDPYFIQTEFEKIKSKNVLYKVIDNPDLHLHEIYSKRYNAEGGLKTPEIYPILAKNVDVRQSRNTSLIEIRVFSENKDEAAAVANEIAKVYKDSPRQPGGAGADGQSSAGGSGQAAHATGRNLRRRRLGFGNDAGAGDRARL
jgi:succinoglycan biosynthesis transport protein ExoP